MNVADIKAQVAANEKGVQELQPRRRPVRLATVVSAYMRHVMDNAEESVRRVIDRIGDGAFRLHHGQRRDALRARIGATAPARTALVDFTGTGPQNEGNFNAPPAVTRAGVLYVFRCLVGDDIPLNDGCLKPITIRIPPGTFLSPRLAPAVVAGNTEVSQATCNALFGALGTIACSQATMNNFLFGDATRQYYETICGGTGAGPGFDGTSAVHTHMTNTRMTDPEVLELRYPVILEEFSIRRGSGGAGRWRGGDGARRRIRFLRADDGGDRVVAAQRGAVRPGRRRRRAPPDGNGWNGWTGRIETLTGTDRAELRPGDVFVIETPGGGGYRLCPDASGPPVAGGVVLLLALGLAAAWLLPPLAGLEPLPRLHRHPGVRSVGARGAHCRAGLADLAARAGADRRRRQPRRCGRRHRHPGRRNCGCGWRWGPWRRAGSMPRSWCCAAPRCMCPGRSGRSASPPVRRPGSPPPRCASRTAGSASAASPSPTSRPA